MRVRDVASRARRDVSVSRRGRDTGDDVPGDGGGLVDPRRGVVRGRTALHYFASGLTNDEGDYYDDGHVAYFARWFCVVGAELDATDDAGKTPLHYLVDRLFEFPEPDLAEALTVLLDAGASLNVVDAHGLTPYARAAIYGDVETLRIMERSNYGIDLDIVCARDLPTEEIPGTREPLVQSEHENLRKPIKGKPVGKLREEVGV